MGNKQGRPVQIAVVPWTNNVGGTDKDTELTLFAVPDGVNMSVELLSVGVCNHTGGTNLVMDLEWVDDSDSDTVANLAAAFDLDDLTDRVYNQIWRGSQQLDAGDSVNAEITVTDSSSLVGLSFIVEYRIIERSGD